MIYCNMSRLCLVVDNFYVVAAMEQSTVDPSNVVYFPAGILEDIGDSNL
jgi:hypothetical protein